MNILTKVKQALFLLSEGETVAAGNTLEEILRESEDPGQIVIQDPAPLSEIAGVVRADTLKLSDFNCSHPEIDPMRELLNRCVCTADYKCIKCISEAGA